MPMKNKISIRGISSPDPKHLWSSSNQVKHIPLQIHKKISTGQPEPKLDSTTLFGYLGQIKPWMTFMGLASDLKMIISLGKARMKLYQILPWSVQKNIFCKGHDMLLLCKDDTQSFNNLISLLWVASFSEIGHAKIKALADRRHTLHLLLQRALFTLSKNSMLNRVYSLDCLWGRGNPYLVFLLKYNDYLSQ